MPEKSHRYHPLLISICLAAAIIAVYWPLYNYSFVQYDDNIYVTSNINIQSGLNWRNIRWAFTTGYASNWHPVTWLSHTFDYQLFKTWAGGHHLTNILFHILNTLILFYVLKRMTAALWPSVFVAAAFALHPLHVESVAWIAERKDVLSTFFMLLTIWAYIRYVEKLKLKWYLAAIALFILGLMSKPILVTIPFVLLLLDYWPLERKISLWVLIEKIPFFICSIASSVVTFLVQQKGGAMSSIESFGLTIRINNAIVVYVMYIAKMIWPSRLAVLYPHPGGTLSSMQIIICALLLVFISIGFLYFGRRHKFLTVGWLWYLGMLVPVIGLVQVGLQSMTDRCTYITLTGLFIIISWGVKEIVPIWHRRNTTLTLLSAAVLAGWAVIASQQVRYWKDSITLFEHTLEVTKNNYHIHNNYATYLFGVGRIDEAIEQFNKLLAIKPDSVEAHNNLGCTLMHTGKFEQAIEQFKLAMKYDPSFAEASYNMAVVLLEQNRPEEAVSYLKRALELKPGDIDTQIKLASVLIKLERFDEAIEICSKILKSDPGNVFAHGNLALAFGGMGKGDEAIKEIRYVLKARPRDVEMYRNLGTLLEGKGDTSGAKEAYSTALKIDPNDEVSRQFLEKWKKHQAP